MKNTFIIIGLAILVIAGAYFLKTPKKETLPEATPQGTLEPMNQPNINPINQKVTATIKTSMGDIELELDGAKAPVTVGNFVALSKQNFYNGVTFHRVIPDFMIQGGDPTGNGTGGPGYEFQDEFNDRKLVRGSLAMANSGPNTNGSQFFIVTADATPWLDGKHTNFGTVTKGMDIVDAISKVDRDENDNPVTPVVINEVAVNY